MMTTILLIGLAVLAIANIYLTGRKKGNGEEEIKAMLVKMTAEIARIDLLIREECGRSREENRQSFKENRQELNASFKDNRTEQANSLRSFAKDTEERLKEIRETVEGRLKTLQEENNRKLDEMRKVVDEKLQESVEKRFNESFKLISERLELVQKGLGEMQALASGVGDLKKVLTNVKTRGNLGEIQLGAILEQILSPEQYEQNVAVKKGSQERVEYVIKLPGKNEDNQSLLLPVDSKFPNEDYQRLLEVYDNTVNLTPDVVKSAVSQFENSVKKNAKDIRDKYINPPLTTDFAIMFVPTEGLYAEILRRTGLFEVLQRDYKITVVGPTNLVAFLSSLQMGFKTLAIEKRSSEVWEVLSAVKTSFSKFGEVLAKTKKKLTEAANVIEEAEQKSRTIERKLRTVHEIPRQEALALLGEAAEVEPDDEQTGADAL
jgi:DNA recombination protein RmuC